MLKFTSDPSLQNDVPNLETIFSEIQSDAMAGWYTVPVDEEELKRIKTSAARINSDSDYLVCIGIGGSYLGHKAVIEALKPSSRTEIIYMGNSLSTSEVSDALKKIANKDFSINVISKSGTTTEPAVAFRIFKQKLIEKYGAEEANMRIYATTDREKGALHDEAVTQGYERFVVPDNIGGRYSVLTAVGLLPLAVAGVNIDALLAGAKSASEENSIVKQESIKYAVARQALYASGRETEILASFEPRFSFMNEWWKQLYGESEGKDKKGIFPASVVYTTDLHSLGQYIQDGRRNIFETVVKITTPCEASEEISVPIMQEDLDGLKYLEGKTLSYINEQARLATIEAHRAGGIAVLEIEIEKLDETNLGEMIYFFELACAISAKISGVNPFDQPGVEAYKTNMFRLLGKPGFAA